MKLDYSPLFCQGVNVFIKKIGNDMQSTNLKELTFRGMFLGALITVLFTASNVYLGLKVGMTFASSIPAAVISMAVLKFFKDSSILENNMVQTQASSAGTLSSVIFVLPGLLMMGYWQDFPFWQTMLICAAGGTLGVLFTIPLRRAMVVNSDLPYPEGVAAAEILKAGNNSDADSGVKDIAYGGIFASVVAFLTNGLRLIADGASAWFTGPGGKAIFQIPMGFSLALLGAGYLIGIVGGIAIMLGTFFAWGLAVPFFTMSGDMPTDGTIVSYAMSMWKTKVRFIGVGTIGIAAIWTLLILMKPMVQGMVMEEQAPEPENVQKEPEPEKQEVVEDPTVKPEPQKIKEPEKEKPKPKEKPKEKPKDKPKKDVKPQEKPINKDLQKGDKNIDSVKRRFNEFVEKTLPTIEIQQKQ